MRRIAGKPASYVEAVKLFRPEHSGESLPLNAARVRVRDASLYDRVEFIGLVTSLRHHSIERRAVRGALSFRAQTYVQHRLAVCLNIQHYVRRALRAPLLSANGVIVTVHDEVTYPVFVWTVHVHAIKAAKIGLIFAEQEVARWFNM